ncbi:tyrosine-protein phosphatase non-receptor type 3 isoform X1 [Ranitomeya variabilis]|uniref:tyrosine-protein phosphatase non-receptor type 3 isoform X1 n=2 Tax=Ranitomeya variabilis TaxID=490064 RepID=UPI004055BB79
MNSRLRALGGRINNIRVTELPKEKNRSEVVCNVRFLDGSQQNFRANKQDTGQTLLDMVFNHLSVKEREYFGLQHNEDSLDSHRWLEPNKPIRKQLKGGFPCNLILRVRFFIPDPNTLQQDQTRHLYFLQLKNDILEGRLSCPLNSAVVLASYAVQSEFGDYNPSVHFPGHLLSKMFLPGQDDDFISKVESLHSQHSGLGQTEAESCYINIARTLEFYGVEMHSGRDLHNLDLIIGIASGGIAVYRKLICTSFYPWVNILKISFKRKKFFIQQRPKHNECRDQTVAFNMLNYRACKNLWKSSVEHHTFFQTKRSLPHEKKLVTSYWTLGTSNHAKSASSQLCRKVMGGMVLNTDLRRSVSVEHLETKSLPSRSPPITPNWRSPRLRHVIRKPQHSSADNLINEMTYVTETEDVFYTYKGSPTSKESDCEFFQNQSPQRLSDADSPKNLLEYSPKENQLSSQGSYPSSPNGVSNHLYSHPLEGVDKTFLDTYDTIKKGNSTDDSGQYYYDKNELANGDLLLVRISPDEEGKFGFNLKGGVDQKMQLVVSRITPGSPADTCSPKLMEGDQIVLINGRDISEHTHDQVVMFIKASRESHTRELAVLVRRKVVKPFGELKSGDDTDYQGFPPAILPTDYCDTLQGSMEQLTKGLETGIVLIQFEQLYRKKPGLAIICAKTGQNMDKNRYKDVLPYDTTRVILQGNEDYINASYVNMEIPTSNIVNRYIATQGPLPHTCAHFWQMVWDNRLTLLIMLTTLTERGRTKCQQYWPDPPDVMEYGNFRVTCNTEDCTIAYVFREMILTNTETGEELPVSHLQYVAWPDHGVPDESSDFLEFVTCVRQKRVEKQPMLVHCSAGIGRTGVLITMETAMCLIEQNQPVYPLDIVRQMRDQRPMMVQTSSQYKFVCEAILRVYKDGLVQPLQNS